MAVDAAAAAAQRGVGQSRNKPWSLEERSGFFASGELWAVGRPRNDPCRDHLAWDGEIAFGVRDEEYLGFKILTTALHAGLGQKRPVGNSPTRNREEPIR